MAVFWSRWNKYIIYFMLFSLVVSLVLTGKLSEVQISLLLLPISYYFVQLFYFQNKQVSSSLFIKKLFIYSFFIRMICVFVLSYILTNYIGIPFLTHKDDYIYHKTACAIVDRWHTSGIGFYPHLKFSTGSYSGFPNFSALLMYVFGKSIYIPRIGNAFFSAWTCIYAYQICRSYTNENESRLIGILFMASPLLYIFASLQLKDTMLLFLIFGSIKSISDILSDKISVKSTFRLILFILLMVFFRAASIIPIALSFVLSYAYFAYINKKKRINIARFIVIAFIIVAVIYGWKFLAETKSTRSAEMYFQSRYLIMSESTIEKSSVGISKLSIAKFIGPPLYILGGLFLPPALLVDLPNQETINYTFAGLLFHFSVLPFLIIAIFNVVKNRKTMQIPFYILLAFIFFKIGQANSLVSILDSRQSLASIFLMYLLLPAFFMNPSTNGKRNIVIAICMVIMIAYSVVRLYSRGLI